MAESVPNELNEVYTFSPQTDPLGADQVRFVYVTLKADNPGTLTFQANPSDLLANGKRNETLLYGTLPLDPTKPDSPKVTRPIPAEEIDFGFPLTITITQPVNAVDDVFPVQGGNPILEDAVAVKLDVLANDFLETGSLGKKGLSAVTKPAHGTTAISNNNTPNDPTDDYVEYTPDANFFYEHGNLHLHGHRRASRRISDTATVTVTVTSVNDAPVADNDSAETAEDVTKSILVLDGDRPGPAGTVAPWDESAQTISVVSVSDPLHGTAVIQNGGAGVDYTPDKDFFGTDTFTYVISDGETTSNTATVTVTVTPVNDPPVAQNDQVVDVLENTPKVISVLANDNVGAS